MTGDRLGLDVYTVDCCGRAAGSMPLVIGRVAEMGLLGQWVAELKARAGAGFRLFGHLGHPGHLPAFTLSPVHNE